MDLRLNHQRAYEESGRPPPPRGATTLGFSYDSLDRQWRRTSNATVTNEFSYAGGETEPVMTATAGGAQESEYGRSPAGMLLSGGNIGGAKASVGTDRHLTGLGGSEAGCRTF